MSMLYLIGGMLGRVVAPIAQDIFENKTETGRKLAEKKFEKQRKLSALEYENKLALSTHDHQEKLDEMKAQFELNLKKAEHQMQLQYSEWEKETFWKHCFPLRNPYEVGGMQTGQVSKIGTLLLPNKQQIVPLRVITALKDNTNEISATLNANISLFLANYYSANSEHAIISDIGAWKEDFRGLKGQPTLVVVPTFTDSGNTVKIKLWSWGLGEDLQYPIGLNVGWFDVDTIRRQAQISQLKEFFSILENAGIEYPNENLKKNHSIAKMIENKCCNLSQSDADYLYSVLMGSIKEDEISKRASRKTNEIISSIFSCTTAMYADAYHLTNHGIKPQLPYILPYMCLPKEFLPIIRDYYITLVNTGLVEGIISRDDAIDIEIDLAEGIQKNNSDDTIVKSLCDDVRLLNQDTNGEVHKQTVLRLRQLNNNIKFMKS